MQEESDSPVLRRTRMEEEETLMYNVEKKRHNLSPGIFCTTTSTQCQQKNLSLHTVVHCTLLWCSSGGLKFFMCTVYHTSARKLNVENNFFI